MIEGACLREKNVVRFMGGGVPPHKKRCPPFLTAGGSSLI
jgi:hypothetical protein